MGKSTIYDDKTKVAAFELYRGDTGRPIEQLTGDLEAVTGVRVPGDTIRDWRQRYNWDTRIQAEIAAAAPILVKSHVALARVAGLDGLTYIRDVASGAQEYDKHRYDAAVFLVEEVRPMLRYVTADDDPVTIRPVDLGEASVRAMAPAEIAALATRDDDAFGQAIKSLNTETLLEVAETLKNQA